MEILDTPFEFDRDEFDRRIKIEIYEGMEDEIASLLEKALPKLNPRTLFRELSADNRDKKIIHVGDQCFDDPVALMHLGKTDRVFPYISTCGDGLEEMASYSQDMLEIFWFDALKQMAMDRTFSHFRAYIKKEYSIPKLYSLNPGSDTCREGWDISNQKKIFALLPLAGERGGVILTESLLMRPNKTVSGLLFQSDRDFVSCQECDNIHCPNRRMIHDGAIVI
ncbi:MAG: hypothetical protein JXR86_17940 [Spirochaetales bacterium]|nr:hypothetical protein [Spirochaetales bacterium]